MITVHHSAYTQTSRNATYPCALYRAVLTCPAIMPGKVSANPGKLHRLAITMACALLLSACATSPTGRSQFILISPDTAIVESHKAYINTINALEAEDKLLRAPRLAAQVELVTGRIVTEAVRKFPHAADWKWSVALIDEPETVNAWCMAGGRMAVYSGLFKKLKLTEAEFAQVMGHEIAHALANHTAEKMSVAMATDLGVAVVGAAAKGALTGTALAAQLAIALPNSRAAETEADQIGLELAARAGYDPQAAVSLWEKMAATGKEQGSFDFLSTHPAPAKRRQALAALVPRMRNIQGPGFSAPHPIAIVQQPLR